MQLTHEQSWERKYSLITLKSFLLWCFTLTVCLLVVGFPVVVLMATIGALSAVVLQSVLPISSALLVGGGIIGINILGVIMASALLTFKGIHPQQVSWLSWLHGDEKPAHTSVYASCPLTCGLFK